MNKLVYGFGINDADYPVFKRVNGKLIACRFYERWLKMLERCYSAAYLAKRPTYQGCTVCEEWLIFSNFKRWMESQDWQGKHLDKDIIKSGNKKYCPELCVFINASLNNFLTDRLNHRGEWPIGVSWNNAAKKFEARCSNPFKKKQERIGYFDCPNKAHEAWRQRKSDISKHLSFTQSDERVKLALMNMSF